MHWGYGWPLGPFELADAIGFAGKPFRTSPVPAARPELEILRERARSAAESSRRTPARASSISDDGVLAVSLHSKMNAIGGDALKCSNEAFVRLRRTSRRSSSPPKEPHFSVGANLMLLLLEAQEGNWEEVDAMIRAFQKATTGLRYAEVPVVVAPFGMALGGGCEIVLHGDRVQAAAESYIGLVEVGVGLIPAGGGTKEMLLRARAPRKRSKRSASQKRLPRLRMRSGWDTCADVDGMDDEPRSTGVRRKTAGAQARAGGLSATRAPISHSCRRRRAFERRSISECISHGGRAESPITTR